MFKSSQYRVRLQEVEDREVQQYLVGVEVLQLDREKPRSALIAIDDIGCLQVIDKRVFPMWKPLTFDSTVSLRVRG